MHDFIKTRSDVQIESNGVVFRQWGRNEEGPTMYEVVTRNLAAFIAVGAIEKCQSGWERHLTESGLAYVTADFEAVSLLYGEVSLAASCNASFPPGAIIVCNRCDAKGPAPRGFRAIKENRAAWRIQEMMVHPTCGHMDAHWVHESDLV